MFWEGRSQLRTVRRYIGAVNSRDLMSIEALLAPDVRFIDSSGEALDGRELVLAGHRAFFDWESAFRMAVERITFCKGEVLMSGQADAAEPALRRKSLWRARADGGLLTEWQTISDARPIAFSRLIRNAQSA